MKPGVGTLSCCAVSLLGMLSGCGRRQANSPQPPPARTQQAITFHDRAAESGIRYSLGYGSRSPLSILETAPGGAGWADLDGDGRLDAILVGPAGCAIYRNAGGGRFEPVPPDRNPAAHGSWMGCAVGDYDGDGLPDLFLTGYHRCALLHNSAGLRFEDVTARSAIRGDQWTTSAAFGDVDGDGRLDLYVGAYVHYQRGAKDVCPMDAMKTACGPEIYAPERGRLYRNRGGGRFEDITRAAGLSQCAGKTWGVAFADYDNDGKPDLYLANDSVPGNLYHNLGKGRFEDVGTASGTAYDPGGAVQGGMAVDWGDMDGDGRLDLFVSTYVHQAKELYRNEGGGLFRPWSEEAGIASVTRPYVTFGGGFLDADSDGRLDLFMASGHVRDNAHRLDSSQDYAQAMKLFHNQGGGRFRDISSEAGETFASPLVGRGVAFGDYDGDGREDILVIDLNGPARLLHNETGKSGGHWLAVRLAQDGPNREGIGARITAYTPAGRLVREVTRGRGVLSACDAEVHLGAGTAEQIDRLEVRWPSGEAEEWYRLPVDRRMLLRKGTGHRVRGSGDRH